MKHDLRLKIRRRNGSYIEVLLPPWHDDKTIFSNDGFAVDKRLLPDIFIMHPYKHPKPMKLNQTTKRFEDVRLEDIPNQALKAMPEIIKGKRPIEI